jgi:phage shock protein A
MALFDRISRVIRANVNDLVSKAEDPEKILEQAVIDMQEDLVKLRQAVARVIAEQKRSEQQYIQNQEEANKWQQRAQMALGKGDETLAREALVRKKTHTDTANIFKTQLEQQTAQVDTLKRNLIALESKIQEAKTKKSMLQARVKAAQATEELQKTLGNMGTSSATSAFERMENKVIEAEARSQAAAEIGGTGIEQQFAQLEGSDEVDYELAQLKASLAKPSLPPAANTTPKQLTTPPSDSSHSPAVDDELKKLRDQLKDL